MKTETIEELKKAMNYIDQTECCASCENYRPAIGTSPVFGGTQPEPMGERCGLNVIEIPIDSAGRCSHFKKREPLARMTEFIDPC